MCKCGSKCSEPKVSKERRCNVPFQCVGSKTLGESVMGWKTVRVINSLLCLVRAYEREMLEKNLQYLVNPLITHQNKEGVCIKPGMSWPQRHKSILWAGKLHLAHFTLYAISRGILSCSKLPPTLPSPTLWNLFLSHTHLFPFNRRAFSLPGLFFLYVIIPLPHPSDFGSFVISSVNLSVVFLIRSSPLFHVLITLCTRHC